MKYILISIVTLCLTIFVVSKRLPHYIDACPRNGLEMGECIRERVEKMRGRMKYGFREFGIRGIEPFLIQHWDFNHHAIYLKAKNIVIYGLSQFKIISLNGSADAKEFNVSLLLPKTQVKGWYSAKGKLLDKDIKGDGAFNGTLHNFVMDFSVQFKTVLIAGDKHKLVVADHKINITPGNGKIHVERLSISGIKSSLVDEAVNKYFDKILQELLPPFINALGKEFVNMVNRIASKYPYEKFFPILPIAYNRMNKG